MSNKELLNRMSEHITKISESEYFYINTKRPTQSYTKGTYDSEILNQQDGQVEIAKNPSPNELQQLFKDSARHCLRGTFTIEFVNQKPVFKDWYFWDATKMVHDEMERLLDKQGWYDDHGYSLGVVIDSNKRVVKSYFQTLEDEDGILSPVDAKNWIMCIGKALTKYSFKLSQMDQRMFTNWAKGLFSNGDPIEEFEED